ALVRDGEKRAGDGAGARGGKKLTGQKPDDIPLLRARILRFVNQHVVDALVELVMHPGSAVFTQQGERLVDQIVVVEESAPVLRALVTGDHGISDGQERGRPVAA